MASSKVPSHLTLSRIQSQGHLDFLSGRDLSVMHTFAGHILIWRDDRYHIRSIFGEVGGLRCPCDLLCVAFYLLLYITRYKEPADMYTNVLLGMCELLK